MTDSMRQQRTPCAPSPLAGEGWGGGYHSLLRLRFTPLPTAFANASAVDLPRKGGGDSRPPL
jgi:hypothetical protein